ncbi:hypothetical protein J6590_009652 [Homalodisca vitripennis]|nr:hypothetical protein J6590_009652 [Homalodisca vitripennis]
MPEAANSVPQPFRAPRPHNQRGANAASRRVYNCTGKTKPNTNVIAQVSRLLFHQP